ncbi:heat shock protein 67B1 [Coregonus clupeaformis]|uniref:SHSP domain-containing protein n=1 Tax=Coregonus suidteri TaxID=861788 RepID=A0AAN8QNG4_9TELE|nr:heat shock protein 67B1 [Coregonus clupeaformis]
MTEQTKAAAPSAPGAQSRPHYSRDFFWSPLWSWWQQPTPSSLLPNQDFGLPPFLEAGDLRDLAASSWYVPSLPLLVPSFPAPASSMHQPAPRLSRVESAGLKGLSEVRVEGHKWRITLDVSHFSPAEITLRTRSGFLEIGGTHEERPDEHGFIARCFTRRYMLPIGIASKTIRSSLSGDGILTVEASLPDPSIPDDIIIPIQVEKETIKEEGEEGGAKPEETTVADTDSQPSPSVPAVPPVSLETPDFTPTEPGTMPPTEAPEDGDKLAREVPGEKAHPDGATAGTKRHEEKRGGAEEGETLVKPAGEGREGEVFPDPTEPFEHLDTPDSPDTVTSDHGEQKTDPAQDHDQELHHPEGSGEAAEDLAQPEEPEPGTSPSVEGAHHSKELEVPEHPDMEQQAYTK